MKQTIYYFSGTGNSLHVAQKIQQHLGDAECLPITSERLQQAITINADVLGLVFPVYAWGPPGMVATFLRKAQIIKPSYLFAVATHGGGPGHTMKYAQTLLAKQGLTLDGAFDITMPHNYITGANPPTREEALNILHAQQPALTNMLDSIARRQSMPASGSEMLKTALIHPLFLLGAKRQGKKFSVTAQCTGCGICVKVCPAGNIALNAEKRPEWGKHCEFCLGCINLCPQQAIQSGHQTVGRNRYRHPEIQVNDLYKR